MPAFNPSGDLGGDIVTMETKLALINPQNSGSSKYDTTNAEVGA